ncbi:MAG: dTMP kinase [Verrucomicrobia bacterium]|nr:dTMP kinase [Verrucomicrobiota bacterium]
MLGTHTSRIVGRFISFEGTEGGGKSTQIALLADRLRAAGHVVRLLREPGGTPLGEEIRHTLKHSPAGRGMSSEAELLLMNASRSQLVREVIRPSLAAGEVVLCDRFADSTIAYQGFGRQMGWQTVKPIIDFAVDGTWPDLTLLLSLPVEISELRRRQRAAQASTAPQDRFEGLDREFFCRVEQGFAEIAKSSPSRIKTVDATQSVEAVADQIWSLCKQLLNPPRS